MTKLPKTGDEVGWGTSDREARGTVEGIVTSTARVKGHVAKATTHGPQVLAEGAESGKEAVHRPEGVTRV